MNVNPFLPARLAGLPAHISHFCIGRLGDRLICYYFLDTSEKPLTASQVELPPDIIGKIFNILPKEAQINFRKTCRIFLSGGDEAEAVAASMKNSSEKVLAYLSIIQWHEKLRNPSEADRLRKLMLATAEFIKM